MSDCVCDTARCFPCDEIRQRHHIRHVSGGAANASSGDAGELVPASYRDVARLIRDGRAASPYFTDDLEVDCGD